MMAINMKLVPMVLGFSMDTILIKKRSVKMATQLQLLEPIMPQAITTPPPAHMEITEFIPQISVKISPICGLKQPLATKVM
jgi:hypothetical protein